MKYTCNSGTIHTSELGDPLKSSESHQEQDAHMKKSIPATSGGDICVQLFINGKNHTFFLCMVFEIYL